MKNKKDFIEIDFIKRLLNLVASLKLALAITRLALPITSLVSSSGLSLPVRA